MMYDANPAPLYHQAYELFRGKIDSGEWPEGKKIPREIDLCQICGMSRITIRQALERLKNEGYLTSRQGKGTFVRSKLTKRLDAFYSFSDALADGGQPPKSVLLSFSSEPAGLEVTNKLCLSPRELVFRVARLRCCGEEPFAYEVSYIPVKLIPGLSADAVEQNGLYCTMQQLNGLAPDTATETFSAVSMEAEVAGLLRCKPDAPALCIERIASCHGTVVEYCHSVARGDSIRYQVVLKK